MPDYRPVLFVVGLLLIALAVLMLLPAAADAATDNIDWMNFVYAAAISVFVGGALALSTRPDAVAFNVREAFLITSAAWFAISLFAALPFYFGGRIDFTDAFFESVSGLTTTGSTVFVGLDAMPAGVLLWRSMLQWVGGVGIVVMAIMILPFLRVGGMQLFRSESSDRSEKVVPRPAELALSIGSIYCALTFLCALGYAMAGMSPFDAVNHAMTTLATGGYSTHDASFAYFANPAVHWLGTVFMMAGALPFVLYIKGVRGEPGALFRDQQVRGFGGILALAILALGASQWLQGMPPADALRHAAFNVTSIVTTTGYASTDYTLWGDFAIGAFLLFTFIGGCTGSTAGAIKVFRHQLLLMMIREQMRRLYVPHLVYPRLYNGRQVPRDIIPSVVAFLAAYVGVTALLGVALSAFGLDLVTSMSGAATAMGNVGPGLGPIIGPAGTFASLPDGAKWLLSLGMLLGRLELFTVLVIFTPAFWRA